MLKFLSFNMINTTPGPKVIILSVLNSNEHALSTAHKTKIPTDEETSCFEYLRCCIYHAKCLTNIKLEYLRCCIYHAKCLTNIKLPAIVGILTFMRRIHFVLSRA